MDFPNNYAGSNNQIGYIRGMIIWNHYQLQKKNFILTSDEAFEFDQVQYTIIYDCFTYADIVRGPAPIQLIKPPQAVQNPVQVIPAPAQVIEPPQAVQNTVQVIPVTVQIIEQPQAVQNQVQVIPAPAWVI
jgi:hypothetical protein